jgi:hypothetical protein
MLALSMLLVGPAMNVHAEVVTEDSGSSYTITGTQDDSTTQDVEVTVAKGSTFKVCVPKKIIIQPNDDTTYKIGVWGDISPTEKIVVVPQDGEGSGDGEINFLLRNEVTGGVEAKESVKAKITPSKTEWTYGDGTLVQDKSNVSDVTYHTEVGTITSSGLTAGSWSGTFTLNISLESITP